MQGAAVARAFAIEPVARIMRGSNSGTPTTCGIPWEQLRSPLAGNVVVLTISMDLPFAQARWEQGADLGHQVLWSHRSKELGCAAMGC